MQKKFKTKKGSMALDFPDKIDFKKQKKTSNKTKPKKEIKLSSSATQLKDKVSVECIPQEDLLPNDFEPKTKNRFIVYFDGIPSFVINAVDQPSFTMVKGKRIYLPLKVFLYDPIAPDGAQLVMNKLENGDKTYNFTIMIVGPVGEKLAEWRIKDAVLDSVIFSSLNWSCYEPNGIELTFTLDSVEFVKC